MKTVMLFEDEAATRELLTKLMESAGFDVVYCADEWDQVNATTFSKVDAIVTDVVMPDYDGFDVMKRAKEMRPGMPVVAISSYGPSADVDYVRMSRMLGADATFEKPIDASSFIETLSRLTGLSPAA